jgi:hypothetical protein
VHNRSGFILSVDTETEIQYSISRVTRQEAACCDQDSRAERI